MVLDEVWRILHYKNSRQPGLHREFWTNLSYETLPQPYPNSHEAKPTKQNPQHNLTLWNTCKKQDGMFLPLSNLPFAKSSSLGEMRTVLGFAAFKQWELDLWKGMFTPHIQLHPWLQIWFSFLFYMRFYHLSPPPHRRILHRDLKSKNIFLKNNQLKIGKMFQMRALKLQASLS